MYCLGFGKNIQHMNGKKRRARETGRQGYEGSDRQTHLDRQTDRHNNGQTHRQTRGGPVVVEKDKRATNCRSVHAKRRLLDSLCTLLGCLRIRLGLKELARAGLTVDSTELGHGCQGPLYGLNRALICNCKVEYVLQ